MEENVLNYAEVKALALDDHRMKKLAEKENELAELRIVSGKYIEAIEKTKSDITNIEKSIEILDKQKTTLLSMFPKIKNKSEKEKKIGISSWNGVLRSCACSADGISVHSDDSDADIQLHGFFCAKSRNYSLCRT